MTFKQTLRSKAINQFISLAESRKKILKVETIYFNEPICGITHYFKMPYDQSGRIVPFVNVNGHFLLKMIDEVRKGNIYGWIEYKGSRCKVRPKKIDK
jgi:hypothetical protein